MNDGGSFKTFVRGYNWVPNQHFRHIFFWYDDVLFQAEYHDDIFRKFKSGLKDQKSATCVGGATSVGVLLYETILSFFEF